MELFLCLMYQLDWKCPPYLVAIIQDTLKSMRVVLLVNLLSGLEERSVQDDLLPLSDNQWYTSIRLGLRTSRQVLVMGFASLMSLMRRFVFFPRPLPTIMVHREHDASIVLERGYSLVGITANLSTISTSVFEKYTISSL